MAANTRKGSPHPSTVRLELLLNFCRTVVRCDDEHLKLAMGEYQQFLASQQHG